MKVFGRETTEGVGKGPCRLVGDWSAYWDNLCWLEDILSAGNLESRRRPLLIEGATGGLVAPHGILTLFPMELDHSSRAAGPSLGGSFPAGRVSRPILLNSRGQLMNSFIFRWALSMTLKVANSGDFFFGTSLQYYAHNGVFSRPDKVSC